MNVQLPQHLTDKGFSIYADGIARKPNTSPTKKADHRWLWLVRIPSGWVLVSSEDHARQLRRRHGKELT